MSVLVVYASKHGATEGIAERIAETLTAAGQDAEARPVQAAGELAGHEAFVVGSAVYRRHWMEEACEFVRRNRTLFADRPVWLFSSGPLGSKATDAQARDLAVVAAPTEIAEFREAIAPREHRVFFGALDAGKLGISQRLLRKLPAARALLPRGRLPRLGRGRGLGRRDRPRDDPAGGGPTLKRRRGFVTAPHPPEADAAPLPERARTRDSQLLIDEFLPRYDFAVVHASVLPARPEACYRAALGVDLLRDPVIRTLLGIRSLPQRLADRFARRHRAATAAAEPPRTFRLGDMVRYGWIVLDEEPNVELVLGQIGRPWKSAGASSGPPVEPAAFADFDRPGFAKIAANVRVEPYGATASILTIETRVAMTDPQSLRRFTRYWTLIRPFSALIRRIALRLVAADLPRSGQ